MARPLQVRFLDIFLSGKGLSPAVSALWDAGTPIPLPKAANASPVKGPLVIRDAPPGLEWEPGEGWALRRAKMYPGFRMVLEGLPSMEAYLQQHLSGKRRAGIRRYRERLEQSFNIRYAVYYGGIPEEEYQQLFDYMESFIRQRFEEKNAESDQLAHLPAYRLQFASLIREKKAVCQVIYSGDFPVYISFSLIGGKGLHWLVFGYDSGYSRFYPGFTGLIHLAEWALQEGFSYIDLLKGDLDYKRLFANHIYPYQALILYRKTRIGQQAASLLLRRKISAYYGLLSRAKTFGLHRYYRQWKTAKQGKNIIQDSHRHNWDKRKGFYPGEGHPEAIPLDPERVHPFRRTLFEHLYTTGEPYSEVQVRRVDGDTYLVVGPNGAYRFDPRPQD